MDESTLLDLIPAYTLGVLDAAERAEVYAFLQRSEAARRMQREYQTVSDVLAVMTSPAAPPNLTDNFMAQLAQLEAAENEQARRQLLSASRRRPRLPTWLALTAAALLIIVLAGVGLSRQNLVNAPIALVTNDSPLITRILNDPAGKLLNFVTPGTTGAPMLVTVYAVPDSQNAVLDESQMPLLPNGEQYQLWAIQGSQKPISAAVFDGAHPQTTTKVLVLLPKALVSYQTLAITVEPHGGSPQPTTKPILALAVPQKT